jgi:transposase InsO family protein
MGDKLSQEVASDALRDAVGRQSPSEGLIRHSDRGRQSASDAYPKLGCLADSFEETPRAKRK